MGEAQARLAPAPVVHADATARLLDVSVNPSVPDAEYKGPAASPMYRAYFEALHAEAMRCYAIAKQARRQGKDPTLEVEIVPAEDLAARVEAQVGPPGVAQQVRDATARLGNREIVSLQVAQDVAAQVLAAGASKEKALDQAVRTGLSILTEGVLVAPLEGIADVKIGRNGDGTDYVDMYFAGPIRAAGGTAQAMSVLIGDLVRRKLGIGTYVATDDEVERYKEEVAAYKTAAHLQYTPTGPEIESIVRNCPVCINGEGTEREEVTGNRDLPRVETNQLRGGACLVLAEGLVLKAPKVMKHVDALKLEGWGFLAHFSKKGDKKDGPVDPNAIPQILPNNKYMLEIIAGRPVFGHPSRPGAFRLRYGRARTGGLASNAFHPATMAVLDDFLAVGTQLKVERPGKGTLATPCDTLDGPTVLLHNGNLVRLTTMAQARELRPAVKEIVDLGEILVPFGEFAENNANLPDSPWCPEWWEQEAAVSAAPRPEPTGRSYVAHAQSTGVALHPDATLLWHDAELPAVRDLGEAVLRKAVWFPADAKPESLVLPLETAIKDTLVRLLCLHTVEPGPVPGTGLVRVTEPYAYPLVRCLGLDIEPGRDPETGEAVERIVDTPRRRALYDVCQPDPKGAFPNVAVIAALAGFPVMPRCPTRIGGRMGRPEKADDRKMKPPPHTLFPIGKAGGAQRLLKDAAAQGVVEVELGERTCAACGRKTWRSFCDCGGHTAPRLTKGGAQAMSGAGGGERGSSGERGGGAFGERQGTQVDLRSELERARKAVGIDRLPETIKAVEVLTSKEKVPEPLEKGILRAKHGVYTFKDGTTRFDMTDVPLTHFRPREVGAPIDRLRAMGYLTDIHGAALESEDQVLELRVQDIVVAERCGDQFLRASQYLDDLLVRFYGLPSYYNAQKRRDLIGHMAIGLAPHTSGGVLCRIVGFTRAQCHFGHPYFHAAKRRNCDGDEDAVMLLLDGLLNFSRAYVPDRRGGLMDLPLVLSTRLDPNEVDKEAHNVDTLSRYPMEFYRATTRHAHPKDVAKMMRTVGSMIATPGQYEGFGFTHDTADVSEGPAASAYKTLGSMMDKMTAQMELGRKIRAVDEADVGARVIGTHLLPDIMGNLKSFSKQSVRCPKCNRKYRRMPLKGSCLACGNPNLTLTVHEGSVRKYLEICKAVAVKYKIDAYTHQRILLLEQSVESLFTNDKVKRAKLSDFL